LLPSSCFPRWEKRWLGYWDNLPHPPPWIPDKYSSTLVVFLKLCRSHVLKNGWWRLKIRIKKERKKTLRKNSFILSVHDAWRRKLATHVKSNIYALHEKLKLLIFLS
jgi:hypothetical protein